MDKLDALDRRILSLLIEDSRIGYKKIAEETDCTIGTVHNRIKALQERGYLKRFTAQVDAARLGFDVCVLIDLRAKGAEIDNLKDSFMDHTNVCSIYEVTGDNDLMLVCKFENTVALSDFVKELSANERIVHTSTRLVLRIWKERFTPPP